MMRIARVFPTRTSMTPDDDLAFVNCGPSETLPDIDEVHVSVAFTWDKPRAEQLAKKWRAVGVPVRMGGPAFDAPGGDFEPGMYVKRGMVITSRGCPNRCPHCSVPLREGPLRELPIRDGWNVLDDNLLACSDDHVHAVFEMLARQERRPVFSGGLEARRLQPWHAEALRALHPERMYFAYDTVSALGPLMQAGKLLRDVGFNPRGHRMCCYVLIGYRDDTFEMAEARLTNAIQAGFMPYAMLYRDNAGETSAEWRRFQREWLRPQIVGAKMREVWKPC